MKFSEYAYKRPVFEDVKEQQLKLIAELGYAKSFEQAEKAFLDSEKLNRSVQTMGTLASMRFTLNTADGFYKAEQEFWPEVVQYCQCGPQRSKKSNQSGNILGK